MARRSGPSGSVGIPVRLLFEGETHRVTVELKNGDVYAGTLEQAEESMNCHLENVIMTARSGKTRRMEQVYLRGSQIKFIMLPPILKNATVLKKVTAMQRKNEEKGFGGRAMGLGGRGSGRGRGNAGRGGGGRGAGGSASSSSSAAASAAAAATGVSRRKRERNEGS